MKDVYAQATITPFRDTPTGPLRYKVEVDGFNPYQYANPGIYGTPEAAIAAFTPPLSIEKQLEAPQVLREGRKFTFSLSDLSL